MYTGTHHLLSILIPQLFGSRRLRQALSRQDNVFGQRALAENYYFQCGSVRPDNGATPLHHHGGLDSCRERARNELVSVAFDLVEVVGRKALELGVSFHYLEDSFDRSKRARRRDPDYCTYLRDYQFTVVTAMYQTLIEGKSPSYEKAALQATYRHMVAASNSPRPSSSLVLPYLSLASLKPLPNKKSFKRTLKQHLAFFSTAKRQNRAFFDYYCDTADSQLARLAEGRQAMFKRLNAYGYRKAVWEQSARIFYACQRTAFGSWWQLPVDERRKKVLPYLMEDLGYLTAACEFIADRSVKCAATLPSQ